MTKKQHFILILILGALTTVSPFSIDMYLPAFPSIARDLHTVIPQVQFSLTSYFIGISIGQLLYGPLLDRFGRKPPLYGGLMAYILTSLACIWVTSVHQLIAMRFLQALGGCVGLVASRALVRDLFPVTETAKVFSTLMLVLAVSPMLAPTIGGYMAVTISWHGIFIILAAIGALILAGSYFYLPEGRPADRSLSLKPKPILTSFALVLKQPRFFVYAVGGSISAAVTYSYISGSPDVFMGIYKIEERKYGWIFAFIAAAIIGSSQLNHLFLKKFTSEQLIKGALIGQLIIGSLLIAGTIGQWFTLYEFIGMIFLFMCGQGFTFPNASALSLAPFSRLSGTASALLGALQLGIGSLASALVSIFNTHSALPMIIGMVSCAVVSFILLLAGNRFWLAKETANESL